MLYIFLRILFTPILVLKYIFKHPAILLLFFLAFGVFSFFRNTYENRPDTLPIPEYQLIAPSAAEAPTVIATQSRVYYVVSVTTEEWGYLLLDYYTYEGSAWIRMTTPLPLHYDYYGGMMRYERSTN